MADTKARTASVSGICVPVSGEEEDYLQFVDYGGPQGERIGMSSMAAAVNAERISWSCVTSFKFAAHNCEDWVAARAAYREKTGRKYPRLYRARITLEMEPVPDEEAEVYWKNWAESYK